MRKIKVSNGIFWVEIPAADLRILCGCPADSVKHLMKRGLISTEEKNGVACESGPNAILLSDIPLQKERFCNLGEFPVLQMLYRQGMIIPGHPNNTGRKPMLIGNPDQLRAQAEYIFRGNYGLVSEDEIQAAGVEKNSAHRMMRVKLRFAFNKIRKTEELLDMKPLDAEPAEIVPGVTIARKALNIFEIAHGGDAVTVDLNLGENEAFEPSYRLGFHQIRREYFSIVHSGEGDGWDINRPCMASILTFQGKIYLVDAGPNIIHSLAALGININEIEGIFHTHAHDDHFNGLTVLMRSDHRMKYFATPLVRASVSKKLSALLSTEEDVLSKYFKIKDLRFDEWQDIAGLEVKPVFSPHPVETSVMLFRALWENGYRTYAHLADVTMMDVLKGMVADDSAPSGITAAEFERVKLAYLEPVDVKKIDCGGGMIHGKPEDFADDASDKIILSHFAGEFTPRQLEIGSTASFGTEDVLVPAEQDYTKSAAFTYLKSYFPDAPDHDVKMLLNCPTAFFNPGSILVKKGEANANIYLVLSGAMEFVVAEAGVRNRLSAGSMAGEFSGITSKPSVGVYRAVGYVGTIKIPSFLYVEFLKRNDMLDDVMENLNLRRFLQWSWLFGEMLSCPLKSRIARAMKEVVFEQGGKIEASGDLILVKEGKLIILLNGSPVGEAVEGDFFGEDVLVDGCAEFAAEAAEKTTAYRIPAAVLADVPIVQWKLLETCEMRSRAACYAGI